MTKIGILLPRSTYYNTIGFDIHQGLKSGLEKLGRNDIQIVTENVGFGAEKNIVYRAAERLLLDENVSVVFAYITHRSAQLLRPLFLASNRILIVLDAGSNLPQEWPSTPNILFHSLHNSLGAWLSGMYASEDGYKNGGLVTGYYDGGYLHTAAITYGYQKNGGTITYNHATGYVKEDFSMTPLVELRKEDPKTCLLSLFSGDYNEWFFSEIKQNYPNNCPPIYLAPFGCEETMLENAEYPGDSIKGIASWSSTLENNENKLFCDAILESGKTPNLFSLLGWEAASLAAMALDAMTATKNNGRNASELIKTKIFESPRGSIHFHEATNTTLSPMYKVQITEKNDGRCQLNVLEECENCNEVYEEMIHHNLNGAISGWYNSYTCN